MPLHRKSGAPVLEATTISSWAADARSEVRLSGEGICFICSKILGSWCITVDGWEILQGFNHPFGGLSDFAATHRMITLRIEVLDDSYWLFSHWQLHHGWGIYFDICCIVVLTAPGYPGVRGYPMFQPYPPQVPTVIRAINKWNTNQPFFHGHALTVAPMFCSFCCWSKLKNFRWIDYTLMWGNLHPISILPTWFNEGMAAMALQNRKIHMVTVIELSKPSLIHVSMPTSWAQYLPEAQLMHNRQIQAMQHPKHICHWA